MGNGTTVINRLMDDMARRERTLGNPLRDEVAIARRQNLFSTMTGGKGFREAPKSLETDSQGRTRGERKRALRAAAKAKAMEQIGGRA